VAIITVQSANGNIATCKVQVGNILKGDLNKNGNIDLTDILLLIKLYFGKIEMTEYYKIADDMNYSDTIELTDILLLIKTYFGK